MDKLKQKQWFNNLMVLLLFPTVGACGFVFDVLTGCAQMALGLLKEYRDCAMGEWTSNANIERRRKYTELTGDKIE